MSQDNAGGATMGMGANWPETGSDFLVRRSTRSRLGFSGNLRISHSINNGTCKNGVCMRGEMSTFRRIYRLIGSSEGRRGIDHLDSFVADHPHDELIVVFWITRFQ